MALLDLPESGSIWNIVADPKRPGTMYIRARNGIYRSSDGIHFSRIEGSPTSWNMSTRISIRLIPKRACGELQFRI